MKSIDQSYGSDFKNEVNREDKSQENTKRALKLQNLIKERDIYTVLLKNTRISQFRQHMRVHSKGLGVVCKSEQGIAKNSLVTPYFGEVYPMWYWALKQEAVKAFLLKLSRNGGNDTETEEIEFKGDFYNMVLEKNGNEPDGRDIVVIDPILKGNFASRISHSCNPNCMAFPVISRGQYYIAMYAIRDIKPGEELTFDYCSTTESKAEHDNLVCLCSSKKCTGHYVDLERNYHSSLPIKVHHLLIDNESCFALQHYYNVANACSSKYTPAKQDKLR